MPYILSERRAKIVPEDDTHKPVCVVVDNIETIGELNYAITRLVDSYVKLPSYAAYNEVIGLLECVKLEIYRRVVGVYEDGKRIANGDVYDHKYLKMEQSKYVEGIEWIEYPDLYRTEIVLDDTEKTM